MFDWVQGIDKISTEASTARKINEVQSRVSSLALSSGNLFVLDHARVYIKFSAVLCLFFVSFVESSELFSSDKSR